MKKSEFLNNLHSEREAWDTLLAKVDKDKMTEASQPGGWSLKDVIAHIAWHEREMIGLIKAEALVGSEWWELPMDERNNLINQEYKDRPLSEVLAFAKAAYQDFLKAFEGISEAALTDPSQFKDMPTDWVPWKVIASNSYQHYRQHIPEIEEWLAEKKHNS